MHTTMDGFTYEAGSYNVSHYSRERSMFSSSNPILSNSSFDFSEPFSTQNIAPKEVKKKRDLSSVLDDFTCKLSLSVGTTIHRTVYHLLNYCYSQHILSFPDSNIPYKQYSIRMDQDKQYHVNRRDADYLLSIDENETIQQFVNEVLILFDDANNTTCFQFIVTNDKVEGNGRVLIHINPHPKRNLKSFQLDESPTNLNFARTPKPSSTAMKTPFISYASSINQSLFTPQATVSKNHSILARTSLHRHNHLNPPPISKHSEDELAALFSPKVSKRRTTDSDTIDGMITWSEQSVPPLPTDTVTINQCSQRNTESNSILIIDKSVYTGRTESSLKDNLPTQPKEPTVDDELSSLFQTSSSTNQQLASVFTYGNTITTQSTLDKTMAKNSYILESFDDDSVFTNDEEEEKESEGWFFQREASIPEETTPTSISLKTDLETASSSGKTDKIIDSSSKKSSLLDAFKGIHTRKWSKHQDGKHDDERNRGITDDSESSFSISIEGSSNSETTLFSTSRSRSSNPTSFGKTDYCQFFGCHRMITSNTVTNENNRCIQCSFLFCEEHKPALHSIGGKDMLLCDSCFNTLQKQQDKIIPEKSSLSSSLLVDYQIKRKPVVVSFFSPPLGISLQCGKDNRNATVIRFERFDNNDNGMRVALSSSILQINDIITIDMDYVGILNLIKKASFPIVIVFGPLYDSIQENIQNILLALVDVKENTCNFALCTTAINNATSRKCSICERLYCPHHCRRMLFLEDVKPEYVCQFCFPCIFKPFDLRYPVQWIPDYLVNECTEPDCSVTFSSLQLSIRKRRHHCRLCGNVFCDRHCNKRVVLSELNITDAVRVCNYCFLLVKKYREEM